MNTVDASPSGCNQSMQFENLRDRIRILKVFAEHKLETPQQMFMTLLVCVEELLTRLEGK